jgi:hypothetical protein
VEQAWTEGRGHDHRKQDGREGERQVDQPHDDGVHPAAEEAGQPAEHRADDHAAGDDRERERE